MAYLHEVKSFGGEIEGKFTACIRNGTGLQVGYGNGGAGNGLAIGLVRNDTRQRTDESVAACQQAMGAEHKKKSEEE